jgi:DNA-binding transcriptional MerR regulator
LLARPGATISWVAKIMGLHERTIRIYAGKVDA